MKGAALSLLVSLALVPLSAISVSADANPANHGHHYGQIKHRAAPPPPPPAPAPPPALAPPPAPAPPPATTAPPPTTTAPPATTAPPPAAAAPAAGNQSSGPVAPPAQPATEIRPPSPQPQEVKIVRAVPQRDQLWWLLLVLAATLAVLWLFVSVQLARAVLKLRAVQVSG